MPNTGGAWNVDGSAGAMVGAKWMLSELKFAIEPASELPRSICVSWMVDVDKVGSGRDCSMILPIYIADENIEKG